MTQVEWPKNAFKNGLTAGFALTVYLTFMTKSSLTLNAHFSAISERGTERFLIFFVLL
jgi:hypothetical protein